MPTTKKVLYGKKKLKRISFCFGSLVFGFVLVSVFFFPVFSDKSLFDSWFAHQQGITPLVSGDNDSEAYTTWYPPVNSFGAGPIQSVNWNYWQQWLNNSFQWTCQKSTNKISWISANQYLSVIIVYNESNQSAKLSIILNTTGADQNYYYRFVMNCNKTLLSYMNNTGAFYWNLTLPANLTDNYTVMYDFSDLKPYIQGGLVTVDNGVYPNNTFWCSVTSVTRFQPNTVHVIDPTFGSTSGTYSSNFYGTTGMQFTLGTPANGDGYVDNITFAMSMSTPAARYYQCALYTWAGNNDVGTKIAVTENVSITVTNVEVNYTFNFSSRPWVANGTKYFIGAKTSGQISPGEIYSVYPDAGYSVYRTAIPFDEYPIIVTGESPSSYHKLIYASYTPNSTGWSNHAPTITSQSPSNASTGQVLNPTISAYIGDADGNTTTVNWYSNASGSWTWYQTNTSVTANTTVSWVPTIFNNKGQTYWWNVTAMDETANTSSWNYFTTSGTWNTIATWNETLSNTTSWNTISSWNETLSNTSSYHTVQSWNETIVNLSQGWHIIGSWNETLSNTSLYHTINTWNETISNTSSFHTLVSWNETLVNLSLNYYTITSWNETLTNNTFSWHNINSWNETLVNLSQSWHTITSWNETISNGTFTYHTITSWNETISNLSYSWHNLVSWNETLTNLSAGWNILNSWNETISNISNYNIINSWNETLYNSSIAIITQTNPIPANSSSHIIMNVILNITLSHYNGSIMNITWYWGDNISNLTQYLGSTLNIGNGTYSMQLINASTKNTNYYWSVNATDGYIWENDSFNFTSGIKGQISMPNTFTLPIGILLGFFLGFIMLMIWYKKKEESE